MTDRRLPLPLLIACWKERHEVLIAADPNDEHSLVGGLPGLIEQTIARLEESLGSAKEAQVRSMRHPTRAEIG